MISNVEFFAQLGYQSKGQKKGIMLLVGWNVIECIQDLQKLRVVISFYAFVFN